MKIRTIVILIMALAVSSTAFARNDRRTRDEKDDSFALKAGYFASGEEVRSAGAWDLEVDGAAAFGAEYYAITRNDIAVSVSAFFSRPDVEGVIWDGADWVRVDEEFDFWQLSLSYIKFAESVEGNLHSYEGGYYGVGVGYSRMNMDEITIGGVNYEVGDVYEKSIDLNVLAGYKWFSGFGVEGKWIADEESYTLMGAYWF